MFKNASNFRAGDIRQINAKTYHERADASVNVTDGGQHVRNINAEVYHHHEVQGVDPLRELYSHVAAGAMHNSKDRVDAPKCHPETRKAVQQNIFGWIDDGEPGQLLWLTGPAGAGKTAIMGSVCDKLKETEQLAATFYFTAYTGGLERKSKDGVVTTLAYQLRAHPDLRDRMTEGMLSTIRQDPAIFRMDLKAQMEGLVLQHLRSTQGQMDPRRRGVPLVIIIDGVDECGLDQYSDPDRSRQKDQIDVLTTILDAVLDPSFPCRVIVASGPETCIRRFFTETAAGHSTEIFLDNEFNPDKDIEVFLKSKFAEISRRYNFAPSKWPTEEDIQTLPPKKQLEIVLRAKPPKGQASPFAILDALYIAVLISSPSPSETVLWLKAYQRLRSQMQNSPSVWMIDHLFESSEGQAQILFGLPSLVFTQSDSDTDTSHYGQRLQLPTSNIPNTSWGSTYSFYHKSFLDFLDTPARSGVAFPDVTNERVVEWIWGRFHRMWKCGGPEVPIDEMFLVIFHTCFADIMWHESQRTSWKPPILRQEVLSKCNPAAWYKGSSAESPIMEEVCVQAFLRIVFILVHTQPKADTDPPNCRRKEESHKRRPTEVISGELGPVTQEGGVEMESESGITG
ncbi:hypothetical protein NMY22_g8200 [Coprinellus aureogranulatus]|nr:hypothetical protein NMY22_g8200 [Coprinellus aureogranulatus]